jgi:hypothetical protein
MRIPIGAAGVDMVEVTMPVVMANDTIPMLRIGEDPSTSSG